MEHRMCKSCESAPAHERQDVDVRRPHEDGSGRSLPDTFSWLLAVKGCPHRRHKLHLTVQSIVAAANQILTVSLWAILQWMASYLSLLAGTESPCDVVAGSEAGDSEEEEDGDERPPRGKRRAPPSAAQRAKRARGRGVELEYEEERTDLRQPVRGR